MLSALPVLLICLLVAAWRLRRRAHRLPSIEQILDSIHPNVLDGLDEYIDTLCFVDDQKLWKDSGGRKGMLMRNHNAHCLVRLCQRLEHDGHSKREDVANAVSRAAEIYFFTRVISPIEDVARLLFVPSLPHISARAVVELYAEMEARVQNIIQEDTDTLLRLRAIV